MNFFKNANVYIEGDGIRRTDLAFDGRIRGFYGDGECIELPEDAVVLPAFIDEHIHGAAGADTMDGGDAVARIARALPAEGTAYFLATTMTGSRDKTIAALRAVDAYASQWHKDGAGLIGVHLEGPFISLKHVGAQAGEYAALPDERLFDELCNASGGLVKMLTVAPELEGADSLIKRARSRGVVVSMGHTDATAEQAEHAAAMGAGCVTHMFNAQRGFHHREAGTVGAALSCDGLYTELIADCIHVGVSALKLAVKAKPRDRLILVTDAMRAKGAGDGESELGGQKVYVKDGEARLKDGTLAGSVLKMNTAVKNMVERVGVSIEQASDYASKNPAANLGLTELGGIRAGKRASFTVLDRNYDVIMTVRDGNTVYDARNGGGNGKR